MYLCVPYACPGAYGDQKRPSDLLELELELCAALWVLGHWQEQSSALSHLIDSF